MSNQSPRDFNARLRAPQQQSRGEGGRRTGRRSSVSLTALRQPSSEPQVRSRAGGSESTRRSGAGSSGQQGWQEEGRRPGNQEQESRSGNGGPSCVVDVQRTILKVVSRRSSCQACKSEAANARATTKERQKGCLAKRSQHASRGSREDRSPRAERQLLLRDSPAATAAFTALTAEDVVGGFLV